MEWAIRLVNTPGVKVTSCRVHTEPGKLGKAILTRSRGNPGIVGIFYNFYPSQGKVRQIKLFCRHIIFIVNQEVLCALPIYWALFFVVVYFILSRLLFLAFTANLGLLCMPHPGMGPLV